MWSADLPERRALGLSRRLVAAEEPDGALGAAIYLAYRGEIDPAVPVLADNLARRDDPCAVAQLRLRSSEDVCGTQILQRVGTHQQRQVGPAFDVVGVVELVA